MTFTTLIALLAALLSACGDSPPPRAPQPFACDAEAQAWVAFRSTHGCYRALERAERNRDAVADAALRDVRIALERRQCAEAARACGLCAEGTPR